MNQVENASMLDGRWNFNLAREVFRAVMCAWFLKELMDWLDLGLNWGVYPY